MKAKKKNFFTILKIQKTTGHQTSTYYVNINLNDYYSNNKIYTDLKKSIKKYILARMQESWRDALPLEPVLSLKKP